MDKRDTPSHIKTTIIMNKEKTKYNMVNENSTSITNLSLRHQFYSTAKIVQQRNMRGGKINFCFKDNQGKERSCLAMKLCLF